MRELAIVAILLALTAAPVMAQDTDDPQGAEQNCQPETGLWATETDAGRVIFYYKRHHGFLSLAGLVRFELWADDDLVWRIDAEITCSAGVPFCFLSVPMADGGAPIYVAMQEVWDGREAPGYVVFAQLWSYVYRSQVYEGRYLLFSDVADGFDRDQHIRLPAYYHLIHCDRTPED